MATTTKTKKQAIDYNAILAVIADENPTAPVLLPFWPLWAAAQFASDDESKQILQYIHVFRDGDDFQIESTNGHYAFRFRIPCWENGLPTVWRCPDAGVILPAANFKKQQSYAHIVTITEAKQATIWGGKKGLDDMGTLNLRTSYSANLSQVWTFPNMNQLWPEKFENAPKKRFAFNASYMATICRVITSLTETQILKVECNAATTPFVMSADYTLTVGPCCAAGQLQFLLMPVQIRV